MAAETYIISPESVSMWCSSGAPIHHRQIRSLITFGIVINTETDKMPFTDKNEKLIPLVHILFIIISKVNLHQYDRFFVWQLNLIGKCLMTFISNSPFHIAIRLTISAKYSFLLGLYIYLCTNFQHHSLYYWRCWQKQMMKYAYKRLLIYFNISYIRNYFSICE